MKEKNQAVPDEVLSKDFFQAVLFQTDTKIDGLVYNPAVIPYLDDNTVHPDRIP